MNIAISHPLLFWTVVAVAAASLAGVYFRRRHYSPFRLASLAAARLLAVGAMAALAGGVSLESGDGALNLIVLADKSASMARFGDVATRIAEAVRERLPAGASMSVLSFDFSINAETAAAAQTNLELALRAALAQSVPGKTNRILVISDGFESKGDALSVLADIRGMRVQVMAAALPAPEKKEVALRGLSAPERVFIGQRFNVRGIVEAEAEGTITAVLEQDGEEKERREINIGSNLGREAVFELSAQTVGPRRYRLSLEAPGGDRPENNAREIEVNVAGSAKVALIRRGGSDNWLEVTLLAAGLKVDVYAPEDAAMMPPDLERADVIVLDNVPAPALGVEFQERLEALVRIEGKGLIAVGGKRGLGSGEYRGTPLERALPVVMGSPGGEPDKDISLVVVMDTSLSMFFHSLPGKGAEGGPRKIEVAKSAVAEVIRAMRPGDRLGIMESADALYWLRNLDLIGDKAALVEKVDRMVAVGAGINFYSSINEAYRELAGAKTPIRHLVVVCDSNDIDQYEVVNAGKSLDLIADMERRGITLSIFAVGHPVDKDVTFLKTAASLGRGDFYLVSDLVFLPRYFVSDYKGKIESWFREEVFTPLVRTYGPMLQTIRGAEFPSLTGLSLTATKRGAEEVLVAPFGSPLVSYWRYGKGRAAVFTADSGDEWGAAWKRWSEAGTFWGQMLYTVAPRPTPPMAEAAAAVDADEKLLTLRVRYRDGSIPEKGPSFLSLLRPAGEMELPLRRLGMERYQAFWPEEAPGTYGYRLPLSGSGALTGLLHAGEGDEFNFGPRGLDLLDALVKGSGGFWIESPDDAAKDLPPRAESRPDIVFWLYAFSLAALLLELLLRY